jgi:Coat F domain.
MDNQKQQVLPDEMSFNDCDKANDVLSNLKGLSSTYHTFTTEAGSQNLQDLVKTLMNDLLIQQRHLFDMMFTKGWYPLEAEQSQKIQQAYTKNSSLAAQLKK